MSTNQLPQTLGQFVTDSASWDGTLLWRAGIALPSLAGEFAACVQFVCEPTTATAPYEKAGLIVEGENHDGSGYSDPNPANWVTKDAVAINGAMMIGGPVQEGAKPIQTGRVWGLYGQAGAYPDNDGMCVACELGIDNRGSDQPSPGTPTSKTVLALMAGEGPAGTQKPVTTLLSMNPGTSSAHEGAVADRAAFVDQNNALVFAVRDPGGVLAAMYSNGAIKGFYQPRLVNTNGLDPSLIQPASLPGELFFWGDMSTKISYLAFNDGDWILVWPAAKAIPLAIAS